MRRKKGTRVSIPNTLPPFFPQLNEQYFYQLFASCADVKIDSLTLPQQGDESASLLLIYCEGTCDIKQINQLVLPHLSKIFLADPSTSGSDLLQNSQILMEPMPDELDTDQIIYKVFDGELLLFFQKIYKLYSISLSNPPQRQPEEPNTEVSVKGPKDGFTEETRTNVGLIRKRLKTNQLAVEEYILGQQTRTRTILLFLKNTLNPDTLEEIRLKLSSLQTRGIVSTTQLKEILGDSRITLFPLCEYTGRPDFAVNAMLQGRFVILAEGSPTAIIAPVNLTFLMNTPEDAYSAYIYVAFTRVLRLFGLLLALFLPGFWVALVTYHQDQLPYTLVATLVLSRQGVPLPTPLEALVMLILFELFREAGLRLPVAFGQTLSVVGGLIIGQAAISAGLTSPGILVGVALSVLATFSLVNQDLVGIVSITRILILLICGMFGMFGFLISLMGIVLYLVNLNSFGVYYLEPISPPSFPDMLKVILRSPLGRLQKVPTMLRKNGQGRDPDPS